MRPLTLCLLLAVPFSCFAVSLPSHTASVSNTSSVPVLALRQTDEDVSFEEKPAVVWVRILLLVFAGALQFKAPMLWSESRILRKLECRTPNIILDPIISTDLHGAFSEIYISFSKGRHRIFSRVYYDLYLLFVVSIDALSGLLGVDFSTSEALLALRIMIYFGSFAVLGARALTGLEMLFITGLAALNAASILAFGFEWLTISGKVLNILNVIRLVTLLIEVIVSFLDITLGLCSADTNIAQVANSIWTGKFSRWSRQQRRVNEMHRIVQSDSANRKGTTNGTYWRLGFRNALDLLILFFFTASNGPTWGALYPRDIIPTVVVIETLEFVSNALFLINETQVEPTLFVKILDLAEQKVNLTMEP